MNKALELARGDKTVGKSLDARVTLYLDGAMSAGAMMSGLLVGAGIGLLVLFRTNRSRRENWMIAGILYAAGVAGGILTGALRLI